jgi:hypothetical protein
MGGGLSAVVIAMMIKSMLIQRLEKSTTDNMVPIQVMEVFALDLFASGTSMLFSVSAIMSRTRIFLTMHVFLWGRKAGGLMKFALLLRVVTLLVANFPLSI